MPDTSFSEYLNRLLDLACGCSEWIRFSEIVVCAYTADRWEKAFRRHYFLKSFLPVSLEKVFHQSLAQWLGSTPMNLTGKVINQIKRRHDETLDIFRAKDEPGVSRCAEQFDTRHCRILLHGGCFFVAFKAHIFAFLMGNYE